MKRFFLIIFVYSITSSCSTSTDKIDEPKITGNWIWLESSGGIAGSTETSESTDQNIKLEISANSIRRFVNGNQVLDFNYKIERQQSLIFGDERNLIIYSNRFKQSYQILENELVLIDECNDCYQSIYRRE